MRIEGSDASTKKQKKVKIKASDIQSGERQEFDVQLTLNGYDPETINMVAEELLAAGTINVTPNNINSFVGEEVVLTVSGESGDISAVSDDDSLKISVDNALRKITVSCSKETNTNLTISVPNATPVSVPVVFLERKDIEIIVDKNFLPTYINDIVPITFKGSASVADFNVTSSNGSMTISKGDGEVWNLTCNDSGTTKLTISGTGVTPKSKDIVVEDLIDLTTPQNAYESNFTETIFIPVGNATRGNLSVTTSDSKIIASVSGREISVNGSEQVTGNITIKGRGYNNKLISITLDDRSSSGLKNFSTSLTNGLGEDKLNEWISRGYTVVVDEVPLDFNIEKTEARLHVKVEKTEGKAVVYFTTNYEEGLSGFQTMVTLKGEGFKDKIIPIEFSSVEVPLITDVKNEVPYDDEVKLKVTGITKKPSISFNDENVSGIVSEDADGYIVTIKGSAPGDVNVLVFGNCIISKTHKVKFLALGSINIEIDTTTKDNKLFVNDSVVINVTGVTGKGEKLTTIPGLKYNYSNSGNISISEDSLVPGKYTLTATEPSEATISFSAPGFFNSKEEKFLWLQESTMNVIDLEGLGDRFIGETIIAKLINPPVKVNAELASPDENVVIEKVSDDLFTIKSQVQASGVVVFSGRGYVAGKMKFKFKDLIKLDLSSETKTFSAGESAEIKIPKQEVPFVVNVSNPNLEYKVVNNEDLSTSVIVTSEIVGSYQVEVVGRGLSVTPARVVVKPKDIATIVINNTTNLGGISYTNESVEFSVVGTSKEFSILVNSDDNDYELTEPSTGKFKLTKQSGGIVTLTPVGLGVQGRSVEIRFLDLVKPSLGYNLDFEKFYVNEKPLLLVSENVTVPFTVETDNGQGDSSVITCTPYKSNKRCFEVSTSAACIGTITIKGRGLEEISIPCIFEELKDAEVTFTPANKQGYVTKGILLESNDDINVKLVKGDEVVIEEIK